jgi:hypothetical protein
VYQYNTINGFQYAHPLRDRKSLSCEYWEIGEANPYLEKCEGLVILSGVNRCNVEKIEAG